MNTPSYSPRSKTDLKEIYDYLFERNQRAADETVATIQQKCQFLAENSRLGQQMDEYSPGLRAWPVGNYVIYIRPSDDGIEVVRVLHGARDARAIFKT